jgi:2,3-dihydroxy-2,3-dihydrophenylpropionate dehydrogenase
VEARVSRLAGQVALITGGGSGLGLAILRRFVAEGARVGVLERDAGRVEALNTEFPDAVVAVAGDVRSYDDNLRAVEAVLDRFGRLDCFIGNAAIWDHGASLVDRSGEDLDKGFDELFAINVKGYLLGRESGGPALIASEGSIIFTLSNSAFYPGGGGPLYTASKHAGVGLVRQLAYELAPKVRVNAVAPSGWRAICAGRRLWASRIRRSWIPVRPTRSARSCRCNSFPSPTISWVPMSCSPRDRTTVRCRGDDQCRLRARHSRHSPCRRGMQL